MPAATIQDRERRQQARLLSSLLLALILAIILTLIIRAIGGVLWQDFTALASVGTIAILTSIYRLSRTHHYIVSASLTVTALFALIHTAPLWADRADQVLFYASLPILFSSMLLSLPAMLGVAGVSIGSLLLLARISLVGTDFYIAPLSHTLITTTIIVTFIHHRDLLERERQAALRASESNYRLLLEQASDGIFITDPQGNYLLVNSKGREMLGASTGELLRFNIKDIILSEELASNPLGFDELSIGKTVMAECRLRGRNDRFMPVEVSVKRLDDGRLQAIVRDITERKRAEEALRASEERYRSLFEDSPIPVSEQDFSAVKAYIEMLQSQGINDFRTYFKSHSEVVAHCLELVKIINLNKASLELYQAHSKEELMSGLSQLFDPAAYEAFKELLIAIAQGKTRLEQETINRTLRGDQKNIALSWSVMPGYEATFSKVLVSVVDMTERKLLEEQLRQSQKMEAIGQLAGGVAHDFNNMLTVIKGYAGLILQDLDAHDPLSHDIGQIQKSAERAAELTRQLLAFSRKQILQPVVLDLNAVVTNTDKMLRRLIGEDINLTILLDPALGRVKADPGQIEQVIINLALNARDAMSQGGKLTIETNNVYLDAAYAHQHVGVKAGPYIMLALSDTGSGMDEETRAHIFEPFFTTKEQGKGTGLGLATVHGIVNQSGGHIWVYSEAGQGTTFKVYLPRVEEAGYLAKPDTQNTPLSKRGSETILLVEDEAPVRELARRALLSDGYIVLEASHGEKALRVAQQYQGPIDLLVTDVVMPGGMSGRQLAERLTLLRQEMRVLYMSGYTDDAIVHHGVLEAGIAFLQKPFTPNHLVGKVREVLDMPG